LPEEIQTEECSGVGGISNTWIGPHARIAHLRTRGYRTGINTRHRNRQLPQVDLKAWDSRTAREGISSIRSIHHRPLDVFEHGAGDVGAEICSGPVVEEVIRCAGVGEEALAVEGDAVDSEVEVDAVDSEVEAVGDVGIGEFTFELGWVRAAKSELAARGEESKTPDGSGDLLLCS